MPVALPILAGAGLGAAGASIAGATTFSAIFGAAVIGALGGALPLLSNLLFRQEIPRQVATGRIDDVQLSTFTRTGRIPVVYGFRPVGTNVIHLGKAEFKDVTVASTGRSESHLFVDILLGVAEGPCREVVAFYIDDTPQQIGSWRFQRGTGDDVATPELASTVPAGENFRYLFTGKVFFSGDCGFVTNLPNFRVDLRGIYPNFVTTGSAAVSWFPLRATLDGPTNTLVIVPDPDSIDETPGVITYRVPFEDGAPEVLHTPPPVAITGTPRAFYFGLINALVFNDPAFPRMWYVGEPGLEADSDQWLAIDLGAAWSATIISVQRDERTCRMVSLHQHEDGTYFAQHFSWLTMQRDQNVLPASDFTTIVKFHFKAEDNSYWCLVTGGGDDRIVRYWIPAHEWRDVAAVDSSNVVDIIKIGAILYVFYTTSVTTVDCASGEVTTGIDFTDFMNEADATALGSEPRCTGVAVTRHRYAGVAVFTNNAGNLWRISVFHEPRSAGDSFASPAPFRRWCMVARVDDSVYIPKPGWLGYPGDPPGDRLLVWVGDDRARADKTAEDMIADGADWKTVDEISTPETLATGLTAYSWQPVNENRVEGRRVVFTRPVTGGLEWWFMVRGAGATCATRDFGHGQHVFQIRAVPIDATHTELTVFQPPGFPDPSTIDDFYNGSYVLGGLDTHLVLAGIVPIISYNASTRILTHIDRLSSVGNGFATIITMHSPVWNFQHWSIKSPTELELPDTGSTGTPNPPFWLEGRLVGRGWTIAASIEEIQEELRDNGYPGDPVTVPILQHEGVFTLEGLLYYKCGQIISTSEIHGNCGTAPGPIPPNIPMKQLRLDAEPFPQPIYNAAAMLGDGTLPDLSIDYSEHDYFGNCNSEAMVRDCWAIQAEGEDPQLIAHNANVASWESSVNVIVQDEKAKYVTMSVSATGFRHDWFEGRTTPPAIRMDLIRNGRYGLGAEVSSANVAAFLSMHGYSLETISVDGELIRRFIYNWALTDASNLGDVDEQLLAPAGGSGITEDGRYSMVFENSAVEPIIDFDPSMIKPGSFVEMVRSPKASVNRVRARFFNIADQREDEVTVDDEVDQAATGQIRERELVLDGVTDIRRAAYIARQALERSDVDRIVCTYTTGSWARMLLQPGDPIRLTNPRGTFRRKPFRITSLEDAGEEVQLEVEEISPFSVDDRSITGVRTADDPVDQAQIGAMAASAMGRGVSIEHFHSIALAPMRPLAVVRDGGDVILMANRSPAARAVSVVRAKLVSSDAESAAFDRLEVTPARSGALLDEVFEDSGSVAMRGVLEPGKPIALPAVAYLVKRTTALPTDITVEQIRVTAYSGANALNPESDAQVTYDRPAPTVDFTPETAEPTAILVSTEDTTAGSALEPKRYDGAPERARLWRNPGTWTDIASALEADPLEVLEAEKDYLVIGWSGAGGWFPNAVELSLFTGALLDQRLVVEYSCEPDQRLPLRVWKPLAIVDGTKGLTQSGHIHLEIPPDWVKSARWDQHGNRVGGDEPLYYIRIQRRQRSGAGPILASVTLKNLPLLIFQPPAPSVVRLPEASQGEPAEFRFFAKSLFADDDSERLPGATVTSPGDRWRLQPVAYPRLVVPEEVELEESYEPADGDDLVFAWDYSSASHGWGSGPFGETVWGVARDPRVRGVVVRVLHDGEVLREERVPFPVQKWTYPWATRQADGNFTVTVEISQYDDRGFPGLATEIALQTETYDFAPTSGTAATAVDLRTDLVSATFTLAAGETTYELRHNLGTLSVLVSILRLSDGAEVEADVEKTSEDVVTITFGGVTAEDYKVVVVG